MSNLIILLFLLSAVSAHTQPLNSAVRLTHYVYPSFTKGQVQVKSGVVSEQELNYNIITGEMIFKHNGQYLAIANPEQIDTIQIDGRKWVPVNNKFYEVLLTANTPLYEEFTSTVKEPGSSNGYGTTSGTNATAPLRSLIQTGGVYGLELPADFQVIQRSFYWLKSGGMYYKISSVNDVIKVFPDKKAFISNWVKQNKTKFNNRADVLALMVQIQ